jgi:hydrogenase expression/formation protein HypC
MCLAIPGQIESIFENAGLKMAKVNFGGIKKSICLDYTPDAILGNYVLVHVGFAISIIDEEEAKRNLLALQDDAEFTDFSNSGDSAP